MERLQAIQRQLNLPDHKLIQDEHTQWDSTYYMIYHLLNLIQVCKSDSELSTEQEGRQQDDESQD